MQDTIVVDLDGTLADVRHRRHLVTGKHRDYEAFHAGIPNDRVNAWCRALMRGMRAAHRIVIVSARPASKLPQTRRWLADHEVPYHELHLLRADRDSTPDQELKRAWLKSYGPERILFVVDDRSKVVRMWREEGLVCLQCDDWAEKTSS